MWQVLNRTPFAAAQSWVRDLGGAETWIVVVKATFEIGDDGAVTIAAQQPDPVRAAVYSGEPGRSGILYENDFVLLKRNTDIVVNASAYAPGGRTAASVDVAFSVGPVAKALRVFGDRAWSASGTPVAPQRFASMPITYERAFGGVDPASRTPDVDWFWPNPIGTGFAASDRGLASIPVWNIEYPDAPVRSWNSRPAPAGLGVIGPNWEERAQHAGTYDDGWLRERQPLLPADFNVLHFQAVPADQQAQGFMRGGETVQLTNLTPSGWLRCSIPTMVLKLETRFEDGERCVHPSPELHTIIVEPDVPRLSLVWHSALQCHPKVYKLERTRVTLEQLDGLEWEEPVESLLEL